jgi:hypothetical protein
MEGYFGVGDPLVNEGMPALQESKGRK